MKNAFTVFHPLWVDLNTFTQRPDLPYYVIIFCYRSPLKLYSLSYAWYGGVGWSITVVVGLIVSLLTGKIVLLMVEN